MEPIRVMTSVTRIGEISPLWQNFKSLWLFFQGLFCIGQNFEPNWQILYDIAQILIVFYDQKSER